MWQKEKKYTSIVCLATLLAIASTPMAATFSVSEIAFAQTASSPDFPLPKTIPSGTTVKIDGSSSMARINESLKQSFEQQFSGTKVEIATNGTDTALTALLDGKVDLAALGRGLTPAQEAKGLEQYRLRREKIAIVVSENNPYQGNLTDRQFAKIFRGEITDWSQIGGSKGKIRFIDRPASSDTREAFRNYPVFKASNFATGSTATQLSEDSSVELVKQLGKDGIGYVIANQVSQVPGLRVLKLHNTLPSDSRYPFSQPLVYAYKNNPNAGVAGFLGFSTSEVGNKAQEAARTAEAQAVAQSLSEAVAVSTPTEGATPAAVANTAATASPIEATKPNAEVTSNSATNDATTNTAVSGTGNTITGDNQTLAANGDAATASVKPTEFPWWLWLLPIVALAAGLLWWLAGRKRTTDEEILEAAPSGISGLPVANNPEVNINSPVSTITPDNHLVDNAVAGAALAGGAVVGTGLWSRLTDDNDDVPNQNIRPESEISNSYIENSRDLEEPLAVVMPTTYSGLPSVGLDVDVEPTAIQEPVIDVELASDDATAINEPVADVQLPNANVAPESGSNWQGNAIAGGAALAGGAAAGAGLWSKFANHDRNEDESGDEETQLTPATNVSSVSYYPEPEVVSQPSLETPEVLSTEMSDVWSNTEEVNQGDSNWPTLATNLGGAAAGAGLWSKFANRDTIEDGCQGHRKDEPNDITSISEEENLMASENLPELPEVPHISQVDELTAPSVDVSEIPHISQVDELTAPSVDVSEVPHIAQVELASPSIDVPEVIDTPTIDVTQIPLSPAVEAKVVPEPLPDVWSETVEDEPSSGSNSLNDITLASGAAAAGIAATGAGLWSQFANQNQGNEVVDESISNREVIDTGRDNIESSTVEEALLSDPINLDTPTDVLVEDEVASVDAINLDPTTVELVEEALSTDPINLDTSTDVLVEDEVASVDAINLDPSTVELVEEALSTDPINVDTPTDVLVEDEVVSVDAINLEPSTVELVEEALSSDPINLDTATTDVLVEDEVVSVDANNLDTPTTDTLVEPSEPVANIEVPIEDAELSETNLVSGLGAAGGAVLVGGIASRDWWTDSNDADSESTPLGLNSEELTEETPIQVIEIASANISEIPDRVDTPQYPDSQLPKATELNPELSEIPQQVDTPQYPDSQPLTATELSVELPEIPQQVDTPQYPDSQPLTATELNAELPNMDETAFNAVADAAEIPEDVMETPEEADDQSTPESGINAATIAGGAAVAAAGAALWSASNSSDNTEANVMCETKNVAETPAIALPSIPPESIVRGDSPSNVAVPSIPDVVVTTNQIPSTVNTAESTISLNPRTPRWAYAIWNIATNDRVLLRNQGGIQLALRLYDVTNIDLSYQAPQLVQQYECEETIKKRFVAIPISDRDYMSEIGYITADDRWLMIARSPIVRIFSRPHEEFWFEADAELIIHGATEPGSTVTVGGHSVKLKPDGTFHLRIPFTEELIDYVMTAVANNSENAKTIHMHFSQENSD